MTWLRGIISVSLVVFCASAMAEVKTYDRKHMTIDVREALQNSEQLSTAFSLLQGKTYGLSIREFTTQMSNLKLTNQALERLTHKSTKTDDNLVVPEIWLYQPDTEKTTVDINSILFAYAPEGEEETWSLVEAFDRFGNTVYLDPYHAPSAPVIVVETHGRRTFENKIKKMNQLLIEAGLQTPAPAPLSKLGTNMDSLAATSEDTTKMTKIRLNDDMEPWIKGAAEIYMITSGVKSASNDPELRITPLNYLDEDGKNYYPNQLVLFWSDYTYAAANIQFWEEDGNNNYQQLTIALLDAIGRVGGLAGYPQVTAVTEIASIIVEAMPNQWFSDDDDFVDTCYTIEKNRSYTDHMCAAGNARISLRPFVLQAN